jgi:hypothetical protein
MVAVEGDDVHRRITDGGAIPLQDEADQDENDEADAGERAPVLLSSPSL